MQPNLLKKYFKETKSDDLIMLCKITCLGAAHGIQAVLLHMLENKTAVILTTGATTSIKVGAEFTAFSSAKFALRGLTQSLARKLGPASLHIAHIIIDQPRSAWTQAQDLRPDIETF